MALPLLPTLTEIRTATLGRCGFATEGNIQRNIKAVIDEKIRSAEAQLYQLAPWLRNYVTGQITLFVDETDYDIPDDTEPGQIDSIGVRRIEDQIIYPMDAGIRLGEDSGLPAGRPLRYTFIDQILRVGPTPDVAQYDVLVLQYFQTSNGLINDNDRTVVDGEAIKMLAEILVKDHFGGVDTTRLEQRLERYINRRQSDQSDGEGFQMGGRRSVRGKPEPRNRFGTHNTGDAWHPW